MINPRCPDFTQICIDNELTVDLNCQETVQVAKIESFHFSKFHETWRSDFILGLDYFRR